MISFEYHLRESWPPLAWLAQCSRAKPMVRVFHGPRVEVRDRWFCEAVWDGEYEAGNFDSTDLIFGSGGRDRDGQVMFVSAGTTVDRLQSLEQEDLVWISNSLPCLLAATKAALGPVPYYEHLGSISRGLSRYERRLDVSGGSVRFVYFNNLRWDGESLTEVEKPHKIREGLTTFVGYRNFLSGSLKRIIDNTAAKGRQHPYRLLGTLSSGYDSSAVTALARPYGLREAISFTESRRGMAEDGRPVAARLGMQLTLVSRDAWKSRHLAEIPFLAADAKGEDVYLSGIEEKLSGCVVLTGHYAGQMWYKEPHAVDPEIIRRDRSGLSLTEYRLWAGFIHFPIGFMGARQAAVINKITKSAEMAPWDVPGYSKPIPRRIVEEAGIPRNLFGVSKKAASVLFDSRIDSLSSATREEYYRWLCSDSKGKLLYRGGRLREWFHRPYMVMLRVVRKILRMAPGPFRSKAQQLTRLMEDIDYNLNLFRHIFPWAVEKAKERYSAFPQSYNRCVAKGLSSRGRVEA
jgi:hypothetical protein